MTPEYRDRVEKALAEENCSRPSVSPPEGWRLNRVHFDENTTTFVFEDPDSEQESRRRNKWGVTTRPRVALNILFNAM